MQLGEVDHRVVAITAGMRDGTSTDLFGKAFPDRFFDVGIAEGHAVTFAAGLATQGIRPVVAVYSTFLLRAFDVIVHDVALQDLPVVFALDRAGVAGADGPTHHGTFDINYMLAVPGMTVTAPKDGAEMLALLRLGVSRTRGPFSLRWPRDAVPEPVPALSQIPPVPYGTWEVLREGGDLAILGVGTMVKEALAAAAELAREGIEASVVNCRFLKPYDAEVLARLVRDHTLLLTAEEGAVVNGFGAFVAREVEGLAGPRRVRVESMGIPDRFVAHGGRADLLREIELDARGMVERARSLVRERASHAPAPRPAGAPAHTEDIPSIAPMAPARESA